MPSYIDSITLASCMVNGVVYPRIYLNGIIRVSSISPSDFFYLERFIIPKTNAELVSNARNAVSQQAVGYAMRDVDEETAIFMSMLFPMSEYSLSEVYSRINVKPWFVNALPSIIDNTVDASSCFFVYRVICSVNGEQWGSPYVMGIDGVPFIVETTEEIIRNFEVISIPTISAGRGSMTRDSLFSSEKVIKGVPYTVYTPRYRGPIEHTVIAGSETTMSTLASFFTDKVASISTSISENRNRYTESSKELLKTALLRRAW